VYGSKLFERNGACAKQDIPVYPVGEFFQVLSSVTYCLVLQVFFRVGSYRVTRFSSYYYSVTTWETSPPSNVGSTNRPTSSQPTNYLDDFNEREDEKGKIL